MIRVVRPIFSSLQVYVSLQLFPTSQTTKFFGALLLYLVKYRYSKTAVMAATDQSVYGLKRTGRLWRSWYKAKMKSDKNIIQHARHSDRQSNTVCCYADHSPQS